MRFWLSWHQPTEDYRPLTDPPVEGVLGWWHPWAIARPGRMSVRKADLASVSTKSQTLSSFCFWWPPCRPS